MKFVIYVRAQVEPKVLDGDMQVETHRFLSITKKVSELKIGDTFLLDGAWYDVRRIETTEVLAK